VRPPRFGFLFDWLKKKAGMLSGSSGLSARTRRDSELQPPLSSP
jgi:hypothetical protein